MSGGTITATANSASADFGGYGIYNGESQYVNITGGTVTGTNTGAGDAFGVQAVNAGAKITISGGTVTGNQTGTSSTTKGVGADAMQGNVTITGGTVTGKATGKAYGAYGEYMGSQIDVSGGIVNGDIGAKAGGSTKASISGGYINGSILDKDMDTCTLSGGYYTKKPPEDKIVDGLSAVPCHVMLEGVTYKYRIGDPEPEPVPVTGDSSPVRLFAALACLSLVGLALTRRARTQKGR